MLFIVVVVAIAGFVDMAQVCDRRWMPYNNYCYYFSTGQVQFGGAVVECTDLASSLIEPSGSAEENWVILQSKIRGINTTVWIGLTDHLVENKYVYVSTGETPTYTNWRVGQPGNNNGEHCAVINFGTMQWHDWPCAIKMHYICKKPANYYV